MIQRFSDKAVPAFYRMLVQQDQSVQAAAAAVLDAELQWLVDSMHSQGPFALGQQLGLVDCAIAPFLTRLFILEHYRWASTPKKAIAAQYTFYCLCLVCFQQRTRVALGRVKQQTSTPQQGPTRDWHNLAATTPCDLALPSEDSLTSHGVASGTLRHLSHHTVRQAAPPVFFACNRDLLLYEQCSSIAHTTFCGPHELYTSQKPAWHSCLFAGATYPISG
jgi:hypothetical protein